MTHSPADSRSSKRPHLALAALALALLLAAFLAPSASADFGVLGYHEFEQLAGEFISPDQPGVFANPRAVAVNSSGNGASAGDVYVGEASGTNIDGGRIQQFAAAGAFRRLWGRDVVSAGPDNADEVQSVRVSATAGSFTLTAYHQFGTATGNLTAGSATVANFAATDGSFSVGDALLAPGVPTGTTIVATTSTTLALSQPVTVSQDGASLLAASASITAALPFDAGAGQLESALNSLSTVGGFGDSVSVTGGPGNATGATPYLVSFDGGSLAGSDQPLLGADSSALTGSLEIATTEPGGSGFEICRPETGDACHAGNLRGASVGIGGSLGESVTALAVDQQSGDVYAATLNRVNLFSADGHFLRAFGFDVVASGPDDSSVNERQQLELTATGGTYTLGYFCPGQGEKTTAPIPYDAPPARLKASLKAIVCIGGEGGSVTVAGGPSGPSDPGPYTYDITFGGALGGDDLQALDSSAANLSGAGKAATLTTLANGGAAEVCTPDDVCQAGQGDRSAGASFNSGTSTSGGPAGLAIAPPGAPNAGDVLALDTNGKNRVVEFTPDGTFVRAFGWDVVAPGSPDNLSPGPEVQTITPPAGASDGAFSLAFSGGFGSNFNFPNNTTAPILYNASASTVQSALEALSGIGAGNVSVSGPDAGPWQVTFTGSLASSDVPQLSVASAFDPQEVDISNATGGSFKLFSEGIVSGTTASIPFNASAATVQSALEGISGVGAGNVSVSGPDGGPWRITFIGSFSGTSAPRLVADDRGLTGSSPTVTTSRSSAVVDTIQPGGAFEVCTPSDTCQSGPSGSGVGQFGDRVVAQLAEDPTGAIYVAEGRLKQGGGASNFRVQKLTPAGGLGLTPSIYGSSETQTLTVDASAGQFRLGVLDPTGTKGLAHASQLGQAFTNVETIAGHFAIGQAINAVGGILFPGTTITSVGANTLTLSREPRSEQSAGGRGAIYAPFTYITPDLPFDASAAQLESALNALPPINRDDAGTGDLTAGSTLITNLRTSANGFAQSEGEAISGAGIPPGTTITGAGVNTLVISQAATATASAVQLTAVGPAGRGSVSVTGGPTGPSDPGPYTYQITFDGGPLAGTDPPQITTAAGSTPLTSGTAAVETTIPGGPSGLRTGLLEADGYGSDDAPAGVAIGTGGQVLVSKWYPQSYLTCPDGSASPPEVRIQQLSPAGAVEGTSKPCSIDPSRHQFPESLANVVDGGLAADSVNGNAYLLAGSEGQFGTSVLFRLYAFGELGGAPSLSLDPPSGETAAGATISGTIDPDGPGSDPFPHPSATTYRVDYRKLGESDWTPYLSDVAFGIENSAAPFSIGLSGLDPKTTYEARVTVTKPFGFAPVSEDSQPFTTLGAKPTIEGFGSANVSAHAVDFHVQIDPHGTDTSYHIEYGPSLGYGSQTPEADLGESFESQTATAHLDGLEPAFYHFRVVAHNEFGTATSADQTFSFYPDVCPNAAVRQLTGSESLPDCRAYELVSPSDAGSALLYPGGPSSSYATSPSRFGFFGALSSIPGPWNPPNTTGDQYVATRTTTGWKTHFVGVPADVSSEPTGRPYGVAGGVFVADRGLDRFMQWASTEPEREGSAPIAPYLNGADGEDLGRWPTNLDEVTDGAARPAAGGPAGDQVPSADFSHYFFSTANVAFTSDGLTSGVGSVYDDDISTGTVTKVSLLPGGGDIPPELGDHANDFLRLPAASTDGSHVLIAATAQGICGNGTCGALPTWCIALSLACGPQPSHLYMRVDDALTYDVSKGYDVDYEGMTADGSQVYFTTDQQLTPNDHDSSVDLYRWSQASDSLTRISVGEAPGAGDTDSCGASWIARCGVEVITTDSGRTNFNPTNSELTDNAIAPQSGDVYFYSPEQLDGAQGFPGRRNLYLYREGSVHYVATFEADQPISRIQVSPDGRFAAFLTRSRLTSYDNTASNGICSVDTLGTGVGNTGPQCAEMYRYDADTGELSCVSCMPNGESPTGDAAGSLNGTFMSDDGRVFFSTPDPLVAHDTNGLIDVYEYTEGRPRLITTGIGTDDESAFGKTGLVGVSADGVDVYFDTLDTLVGEDHNGRYVKFYDARSGGGLPQVPPQIPCAAADECHAAGSSTPPSPPAGTGAELGQRGNVASPHQHRKHHRRRGHHPRRRHHRSERHHHGHHGHRAGKSRGAHK